jgi:hypothetical protein
MSWAIGFDTRWQRDIGYGVPAYCDFPSCMAEIDRGLANVCCNQKPYGGEKGCGLYFCGKHHPYHLERCSRCDNSRPPFQPTPDHPDWIRHKATAWQARGRLLEKENRELREALQQCGAALQSLDLETDYYINGTRHPHMKKTLVDCLAKISQIFYPADKGRKVGAP